MRTLKTLALLSLLACSAAHADTFDRVALQPALVSGFVSHHINVKKDLNENNYGIGYRFGDGVIVGYYRNSDYANSVYAAYESRWKLTDNIHVGVLASAVTGYKVAVLPLVLPELALQVLNFEVAATYAPKARNHTPELVAVQLRWGW